MIFSVTKVTRSVGGRAHPDILQPASDDLNDRAESLFDVIRIIICRAFAGQVGVVRSIREVDRNETFR